MDDKSKVKKEINGPLGAPPRKGGLKFAPKVPVKKAAKVVPKKEPVEDSKDETVDKELLMKLKASQVLIIVFGSSFVVSACFSLDALFMYTVFCFILQVTDPFARRVKTEEKRKSTYLCSFHAVPSKFVIRTYKKNVIPTS